MTRKVTYSVPAHRQLRALYEWIADAGAPARAERFATSIYDFCDSLADFPFIGVARDDLLQRMRTIGFRRRAMIAFVVTDEGVEIHGVYYGGRDYETLIRESTEQDDL